MIETIYSNESQEAGKATKVQPSFKMPKNIRQVGKSIANKKIYVEDYVMTFIKQLSGGDFSGCQIAVLLGQCIRLDNCRNIFVSGAVEVKSPDNRGEISFSNDIWTNIYEDIKKYFIDAEIVGWFIGGPGYLLEEEDKILKLHIDNFAGQDKVLLTYDNMEREETFYSYENNHLSKQDGYYIYYEKNDEMQNYMIERKSDVSCESSYDDRVSRDIKTVIQNKKPPEEDAKSMTRLMYAAGTLLAVIILVVGAAILSNYDQMKSMQNTMNYLSRNVESLQSMIADDGTTQTITDGEDSSDEDVADSQEQNLNVEVVPGDVQPLDESAEQSSKDSDVVKEDDTEDVSSDEELAEEPTDNETTDTAENSEDDTNSSKANDDSKETASVKNEVKYYTVQTGDTLAGISFKLYNTYTKVKKIMSLNDIENQDYIFVGQKLIVP